MQDISLLAVICFIAMVAPGPDFVIVTRNALSYPKAQALATAIGIVAGCCVHATYCTLGLALVITKSILLYSVIKYAGACYLLYLGIKCLLSRPERTEVEESITRKIISVRSAFLQGLLTNLLNP